MTPEPDDRPVRPTLRMVAEVAGVSTATASYVLSGRPGSIRGPGASSETQRRVRDAAARLNYVPNQAARGMRTGTTQLMQLSLSMLSDPWSLAVADAVNRVGRAHGLETMILADGDWYHALARRPSDVAFIDAVGDAPESREHLSSLARRGQRLVVFSETLEPDGFDVVRSDAMPGGTIAMEFLVERHSDIACLTTDAIANSREPSRLTPFLQSMHANGLDVRTDRIATYSGGQAEAFAAALELLDRDDRPEAVYATTDFAAIATIHAAYRLGLEVPDDVAVIGLGNTPAGDWTSPRLTTVGPVDFYDRLAEIVVALAVGEAEIGATHVFPWSLVPRESA